MKTLTGIIAAAVLAVSAPLATARDFRSADIHPADYPTVEAVKFMGKLLANGERRQARRQGVPQRRAGLREGHDRADQDRRARHDAVNVSPMNNFVPETIALSLPFLFR